MKIGFAGLGNMGRAMAGALLRAGHTVAVWDRTPAKAEALASDGALVATSPAGAARGADAAFTSLSDDYAVVDVVLGGAGSADGSLQAEPLIRGLAPGAIHLSLSTISPTLSQLLDEAHRSAGQRYIAAPVIGRPDSAERGDLALLVAGQDEDLDRCAPLFDAIARRVYRLGRSVEHANVMKLSANLAMASMLEVFGETYALAESYGLHARQVLEVLKDSMLSPQTIASYGEKIASQQFEPAGFRLKLGLKDVDLALDAAEGAALQTPFASALRERFLVAMAQGLQDRDWSAVSRTLAHKPAA